MRKTLLKDHKFIDGFKIRYPYHVENDDLNPEYIYKLNDNIPSWYISQWFTKESVSKHLSNDGNEVILKDDNKSVIVKDGTITLDLNGSKEYTSIRKDFEPWPHLLLEQIFANDLENKISLYETMNMKLNFKFTKFIDHMHEMMDKNLHTAQFQWFINIANKNANSLGYGDFFWFGLSFLDIPRFDYPIEFMACDGGKEDASNKFIYILDSKKYLNKPIELNDVVDIDFEVLSYIKSGFEEAKSRGFLKNTNFEDLYLNSTNIGFEVTGTFDIGIIINSINLEARKN